MDSDHRARARRRAPLRALAVDFDGTLTESGRPAPGVLDALDGLRRRGVAVVLVTGRILDELLAVFADVEACFDALVVENGAVVRIGGVSRLLEEPVAAALDHALDLAGVPFRRGEALLATTTAHERAVVEAIRSLGLDEQVLRNRGELMVLPAGITKAHGLVAALADLAISPHNTVAVGDAENDLSLLHAAEVGVATANAVDSLKARADLVLDRPNGAGVAAFVHDELADGLPDVHPERSRIELGHTAGGEPVRLPSSGVNVLVRGPSTSGKSYVAGLLAERLVRAGYCLLVVDPEGDHRDLGDLPGVLVVGGEEPLPSAAALLGLFRHRLGSVVIDLSGHGADERRRFHAEVAPLVEAHRAATGLPHWVVLDEAHEPVGEAGPVRALVTPDSQGFVFVTYLPDTLAHEVHALVDVEIETGPHAGEVRVTDHTTGAGPIVARVAPRQTAHVRHRHKYVTAQVPDDRRFVFRADDATVTGVSAGNLVELHRALGSCEPAVLRHHARGGDLSAWILHVFADTELAADVAASEARIASGGDPERARRQLRMAIERRYLSHEWS